MSELARLGTWELNGNIRMLTGFSTQKCGVDVVQWWKGGDDIYVAGSDLRRVLYLPLWVILS